MTAAPAPAAADVPSIPPIVLDARPLASGFFNQSGLPAGGVLSGPGEAVAFVKGAPKEVLSHAAWIDVDGGRVALSAGGREAFGKAATDMADRGLRVLALAYRVLPADYRLADVEQDLVVTALVGFEDPPRPEVPDACVAP